jgi:hypothetical protein
MKLERGTGIAVRNPAMSALIMADSLLSPYLIDQSPRIEGGDVVFLQSTNIAEIGKDEVGTRIEHRAVPTFPYGHVAVSDCNSLFDTSILHVKSRTVLRAHLAPVAEVGRETLAWLIHSWTLAMSASFERAFVVAVARIECTPSNAFSADAPSGMWSTSRVASV